MALPKDFEILEESTGLKNSKGKRATTSIPFVRESKCSNCNQNIEKKNGGFIPHNRRVFRRFKKDKLFEPDWIIEACPGGEISNV